MSGSSLETWAIPRLAKLLPLDEESLRQVISYSSSLSKDESAEHLRNLLDDSPAALEFISAFNSRRGQSERQNNNGQGSRGGQIPKKQAGTKSQRGALNPSPTARRPEGYGDTSGGYTKPQKEENYMAGSSSGPRDVSESVSPASSSRNQSPAPSQSKNRLPPSATGPMISEYLPNVRSKKVPKNFGQHNAAPSSSSNNTGQKKTGRTTTATNAATTTTTTTNNIADITSAIAALEILSSNPSKTQTRKCNCNTSIHPLFTPAPNCTSCGKIICALEGIQPCSFCGTPILSSEEVEDMIRELRSERGNEKMRAHNDSFRREDNVPAAARTSIESNTKLTAAKAHRDKLLSFQAHNAQRTRILDEAADFDIPTSSSTQWMTPAQRALALKKQQRMLRELEEQSKPEWEKKSVVMSLEVKKGKLVRTYEKAEQPRADETDTDANAEEAAENPTESPELSVGEGTFSNNPLLKGAGLVRPTWRPSGEGSDKLPVRRREQKQAWRRVQDDNDDNEQWILDGGLHGYDRESEPAQCG
ncbi:C2HC5 finger protein [Nannizzia gypsea CBS 118893]|uniref:C2HC5 finger protein n=1 Tax=Arthroderma gypseum (strain ATCC MYA-4604 / CBS 118893) TaxID=535722 RepID=E5R0K2_ARTGP|nr:C2HC5 finger protein [Nannizzia gypsea CBS 118893]EFQ98346.1 C2HC5 finger protein [Nannizzia gypsea CBS 118893]